MKIEYFQIFFAIFAIAFLSGCPRELTIPDRWKADRDERPSVEEDKGQVVRVDGSAEFTLHAKCRRSPNFICESDLVVEIVRGETTQRYNCKDCSSIPISFDYLAGREKEYYIKMTAYKGGNSEAQGLSLESVVKSIDYPVVIYAYDKEFCECKGRVIEQDEIRATPPPNVRQFGPHWNE